jgi:acyl carrier protein
MKEITIEKVLEILNTNIENAEISIGNSDVDLSQLGMDSISFIRVIVSLEEEFEVEVPDSFLLLTEMNTVNKIMNVLNSIEIEPKE